MQPRVPLWRRAAILPVAAVLAAAAACSTGASATAANIDRYPVGSQHSVGHVAGTTLTGSRLNVADWKGHVVVVDFWYSTCAPCVAEQKTLDEVARAEAPNGVRFVGIDERDDLSQAQAFVAAHHTAYPSLFDSSGTLLLQFPGAAPVTTPTTIVLNKQGKIAARVNGSILFTQLRSLIDQVAKQA